MAGSLNVLVVDDEPKVCSILEQILTARDCAVRVAHDGLDGLDRFKDSPADLVVTDLKMPKMSGFELLRELKHLDPLLNIVVITAFPSVESAVAAMQYGACDFITKPFDIVQIQAILYRCRQRLSLNRQLRHAGQGMLKLDELNRRLAELNDMKSQFLAAISHEINTPLCLMSEWIYLLSDGTLGQLSKDQEQAVTVLINAYERLHLILQQLVDLMHGHEIVLRRQTVTAQELVHHALAPLRPKAAERSIAVNCRLMEEPIPLEVDRGRCAAALEYVLHNAIKFNREHGSVDVEMSVTSSAVQLQVRDSGVGISADDVAKVFAPFYQVDRRLNRTFEGAGIGLALAKRYVELHGGTIRLESRVDFGTTVTITLPRPPPSTTA